ncbi:MAG: peptide-methionine (S)-S-oxide reductase MsrA [Phycisphaeraceae bacterium]|nr:MAG: peptide-methionine (S)-S-oxide reductase MsrA [Phycisphaeraceae bacterium]
MQVAIFGAGCFWGIEETFRRTPGVVESVSGYSGGHVPNPTYKQVCTDTTGHAEVVKVTFDPAVVSYRDLLEVFWKSHNPTQVNRQGPDVGSQYRTVIFYTGEDQAREARESKERLAASGKWKRPIATQIEPAGEFWPAEEYHQKYLLKRGLDNCHLPTHDGD